MQLGGNSPLLIGGGSSFLVKPLALLVSPPDRFLSPPLLTCSLGSLRYQVAPPPGVVCMTLSSSARPSTHRVASRLRRQDPSMDFYYSVVDS
jgi:hypothetical protein